MRRNRAVLALALVVAAIVATAGVVVIAPDPPESASYLSAEPVEDVPDDATPTDYERLSPDEQELYGRLASTDEMIRINESVRSKMVPDIEYFRYDGEVYLVGEVQN